MMWLVALQAPVIIYGCWNKNNGHCIFNSILSISSIDVETENVDTKGAKEISNACVKQKEGGCRWKEFPLN